MSDIVNNFYNRFEKWGLKKHTPTKNELDYLDNLNEIDKLTALNDECIFHINRLTYKYHTTVITILLLFLIPLYWFNILSSYSIFIPPLFIIMGLFTFVISNKLDTKLFIWKGQRGLFYCTREELLEKQKEKEINSMFK